MIFMSRSSGIGTVVFTGMRIRFFGTDAADETGTHRVTGWTEVPHTSLLPLWCPTELLLGAFTLGAGIGIAASAILNTEFIADTITSTAGMLDADAFRIVHSPTGDVHGEIEFLVNSLTYPIIQVDVAKNTAATVNAEVTLIAEGPRHR